MTSVRSERAVSVSPAEQAARIRRCARALEQKVPLRDLVRIYTHTEIEQAKTMIGRNAK